VVSYLKWREFEEKYSKEIFQRAKTLCDEIYNENLGKKRIPAWGCRSCYKLDGKWCFPCVEIKSRYQEKFGINLDSMLSED